MSNQPNAPVMNTFVWHKDRVFRVSTIDRDSSSPFAVGLRYAETIAWERHDNRNDEIVGQDDGPEGSVEAHFRMCRLLRDTGAALAAEGDGHE